MIYAAVDYEKFSDTKPPRVRASLRKAFEQFIRRSAIPEGAATSAGVPLTLPSAQTLAPDDPSLIAPLESEPLQERTDDTQMSATVSSTVAEVTTTRVVDRYLARHLEALLGIARDERFEAGLDSNLSVGLRVFFRDCSADFMRVLEERLKTGVIPTRVLTEILHTLGNIEDDETKTSRLELLAQYLESPSPIIRDAAAVGLSYLDDMRAAPYLLSAIEREPSEAFRSDLQAVVDQLGA